MLKYKVGLIAGGILAVLGLFYLPKGIIKAEEKKLANTTTSSQKTEKAPETSHGESMGASEWKVVNALKDRIQASTSAKEKTNLLDSLVTLFEVFNRYDSAAYYVEEISKMNPSLPNWIRTGNAYYKAYSFAVGTDKAGSAAEKTREYFGKVLAQKPSDPEIKSKVAMTYVSSTEPMKGIMMLREVLKENPDNRSALFNLGILAMQSGQYDKAIERFSRIYQLNPNDGEAVFYLGMSYFQLPDANKAKEYLSLANKMNTDPAILESAGEMLKELEK